jgi:hypothetical protein
VSGRAIHCGQWSSCNKRLIHGKRLSHRMTQPTSERYNLGKFLYLELQPPPPAIQFNAVTRHHLNLSKAMLNRGSWIDFARWWCMCCSGSSLVTRPSRVSTPSQPVSVLCRVVHVGPRLNDGFCPRLHCRFCSHQPRWRSSDGLHAMHQGHACCCLLNT